jgi:hypothetical protein
MPAHSTYLEWPCTVLENICQHWMQASYKRPTVDHPKLELASGMLYAFATCCNRFEKLIS